MASRQATDTRRRPARDPRSGDDLDRTLPIRPPVVVLRPDRTPRPKASGWSRVNEQRLERLLAEGRVVPPGIAAIEAAKADGSWTKLDGVDALAVPDDLAAALAAHEPARVDFDAFPPSARRGILEWITQAKRPETRAARVTETATLAQRGERANPWPRR